MTLMHTRSAARLAEMPAVLVVEAQAIGMIGVIRSLGRAGYVVHAAAQSSDALGLRSRLASAVAVHPPYHGEDFLNWLRQYVRQKGIRCIIPSEGFLIAIRAVYDEFKVLLPDAPTIESLDRCFAKAAVEACWAKAENKDLSDAAPKGLVVSRSTSLADLETDRWNWPIWLKADAANAEDHLQSFVQRVDTREQLLPSIQRALQTHLQCLLQEHVPGVKATVNLWRHNGHIRARSMCLAMHENPHTGGLTAYRKMWWHDEMCRDAEKRMDVLQWDGVAMVEYRWDEGSQRFWFLELNARYWNALNLDLLAGKDFPRWQVDAFMGVKLHQDLGPGPVGFKARYTVPADVGYLMSLMRDTGASLARRGLALLEWAWLGVNPSVKSDLWFPGDRVLYFRAWYRFLRRLGRAA